MYKTLTKSNLCALWSKFLAMQYKRKKNRENGREERKIISCIIVSKENQRNHIGLKFLLHWFLYVGQTFFKKKGSPSLFFLLQ